jgi:hypothetical protein
MTHDSMIDRYDRPAGRRTRPPDLLSFDVSGSIAAGRVAGTALTPRDTSAALALVTAATEPEMHIAGFAGELVPLALSPSMRLDDAVKAVSGLPFGRTDCAQPMLYALQRKLKVDAFVVYTDSETWVRARPPGRGPACVPACHRRRGEARRGRLRHGDPGCDRRLHPVVKAGDHHVLHRECVAEAGGMWLWHE